MPWPEALIFDVDGTLAETEPLHLAAFNAVFAQAGLWQWSEREYRTLLTTTGGKERIARYITEHGWDLDRYPVADLHAAKNRHYAGLLGQVTLREGIAELIAGAQASGIRLAIATTTSQENVVALLHAVGAEDVFESIAAGDMVAEKKPAPDVYLLALRQLGLPAEACLALEDSRQGLRSAKAAGLRVALCPALFTKGDGASGADILLESFADLKIDALREMA